MNFFDVSTNDQHHGKELILNRISKISDGVQILNGTNLSLKISNFKNIQLENVWGLQTPPHPTPHQICIFFSLKILKLKKRETQMQQHCSGA